MSQNKVLPRPSRDEVNLLVCQVISLRATCKRAKVGCVITQNHRIVSTGYNGGLGIHDCETQCTLRERCKHAVHAEANAICAAAREGISLTGATLYCSYAPCENCVKLIIQSGIDRVIYTLDYHSDGLEMLRNFNIEVKKVELHENTDKDNPK